MSAPDLDAAAAFDRGQAAGFELLRPRIATLEARCAELRGALRAVHDWRGLCDANEVETFERIAAAFKAETGYFAPGKSVPLAMNPTEEWEEQRRPQWDAWCKRKNDELDAQIRAALAASDQV